MSAPLYTCLDCERPVHLDPPLSRRVGQDGTPMTREEALCIFRGGRCTKCYLAKRSRESEELMRKHVLQYDKVQVIHIT